jgi:hypoxanthine-DNA glycosylase
MDELILGFPPIKGNQPKILILGTMPSVISLRNNEYYANPMNAFWKIIFAIRGTNSSSIYEEKKHLIQEMNLALWDICHTCIRQGSADSDIHNEIANPIIALLAENPSIRTIIFNGQAAQKLFHRHFKTIENINLITLPSTSPAYTLPFQKKLEVWESTLNQLIL